ncbi:2-aminoethylphosphonate ABC transporter permease subunit [Streptomyces sp. GSL17-111]|uniref:2-aminoethylphosphonate ABC transporter permease subunit n=1 Tax=Streptomyces sp. GSL17-111 TaxID=3121596 RepID=UPI0040409893
MTTAEAPLPAPLPEAIRPPSPPHTAGRRRAPRSGLWLLPPLLCITFALLYPLALVVWESFSPETGGQSLEVYRSTFDSEAFRSAVFTTVYIGLGATAGCLVLGFGLSLVIAFVPFTGSRLIGRFIDIFLSFPSFLITLALVFVYGSAGMVNGIWADATGAPDGPVDFLATPWGVLLAQITFFTPFVMRPLLAAFSQLDTSQLEIAASLGARPGRVIRQVILPEARPALVAGGSLVLVMSLNDFGIVLFTGAKDVVTLPLLVYTKAIFDYDYPAACVVAVVSVVLSVSLYLLYRAGAIGASGGHRAGA